MNKSRERVSQSRITVASVGFLLAMVVLYLYFLNMSVVQVVLRTEHVQQQRQLHAEIANLEAAYIEVQHTVASRIAGLEGYNMNTPKIFVSRSQANLVFNDE